MYTCYSGENAIDMNGYSVNRPDEISRPMP